MKLSIKVILLVLISCLFSAYAAPALEKDIFKLSPKIIDPNTLSLTWHIEEGNFLYKNRFSFKPSMHQTLGPIRLPNTFVDKKYPNKTYQVYRNEVSIPLSLLSDKAGTFILKVSHQGCADSGFCYPPTVDFLQIKVNKNLEMVGVKISTKPKQTLSEKTTNKATSPYESLFEQHNLFMIVLSFFGLGLLLAFTPCVLPMVPVLSGIIVGQHKNISSKKALLLSISYVLGMSLTYAAVGITIAALGQNLQTLFQSTIIVSTFALLFVLLALSMFDFYNLNLPQTWQAKIAKYSKKQNNGAYLGAATMGALSTLILSPCVTAPLVGALSYIAKTSDMLLGGLSLLALGLGMGTPLIIVGASAGHLLPKVGAWMNHVKHLFGVILLAIAITLAERVAPASLTMLCWSLLCIIGAIFLGLFERDLSSNQAKFAKGIAIVVFSYGLLILIGVAMGNNSPYRPLQQSTVNQLQAPNTALSLPSAQSATFPVVVDNLKQAKQVIAQAKQQNRKVLIDFYADWCAACKEVDKLFLNELQVQQALKDTIWLKVDVTKRNGSSEQVEKAFKVIAPPTLILLSDRGKEVSRLVGDVTKQKVIEMLKAP